MIKKISLLLLAFFIVALAYIFFFRKDLTLSSDYVINKYKEPHSKFIDWKGAKIHYTDNGQGIPILMIHGFGGSHKDFKDLDSLMSNEYRIIRIDLPGFGLSDFPGEVNSSINFNKAYSDFFDYFLTELKLDSLYVMGNSLGGMMAWYLALQHPTQVKKLVLFNSAGYSIDEVRKTAGINRFSNPILKLFLRRGIPYFMTKTGINRVYYQKNIKTEDKTKRTNDIWNKKGNLNQIISMANSGQALDESLIKNIKIPTLIIWGKEDVVIDSKFAEKFHQDIENSQLIIYDSCGHVPMTEMPEKVYTDVEKFLSTSH